MTAPAFSATAQRAGVRATGGTAGVTLAGVWWIGATTLSTAGGSAVFAPEVAARLASTREWAATMPALADTLAAAGAGLVAGAGVGLLLAVLLQLATPDGPTVGTALLAGLLPVTTAGPALLAWAESSQAPLALAGLAGYAVLLAAGFTGLRGAPPGVIGVVRASGGRPLAELVTVRLPAAAPSALVIGLGAGFPVSVLAAVLAEYVGGGGQGLGGALAEAQAAGDAARFWSLAVVAGLVAGLGPAAVGVLSRLARPWSEIAVR